MKILQENTIERLDEAQLTLRLWVVLSLLAAQLMLEVFDYFMVGFLISEIAPTWHLTFGQSSIMLMASGVGTILGSLVGGQWADRSGRKPVLVISGLLFSISAGAIAFIPAGAWILFSALRFCLGVGFGGTTISTITLIVELVPTSRRTSLSSATQIPIGLGVLLASVSASLLLGNLGWRGLAMLGFMPVVSTLLIGSVVPESIRWQMAAGRFSDARRGLSTLLNLPVADVTVADVPLTTRPQKPHLLALLRFPRQFWLTIIAFFCTGMAAYSVLLWGPIILANILRIAPKAAASYFVVLVIFGMFGRIAFTLIPNWVGRRHAGEIMGYCAALTLAGAAFLQHKFFLGVPLFLIFLVISEFFFEGGFSNMVPYAAELFPVNLAASGTGLSQATLGVARIVSPSLLALFAGGSTVISPAMMSASVFPALIVMALCMFIAGLAFTFLAVETRGKALLVTSSRVSD